MSEANAPQAHILIVDDEEGVRNALRRVLRKENYRLSFAASADEALEFLKTSQPDVILSDHLMPGMTGLEMLKLCRMRHPDVGRVVLTGQAEMETVIQAINDGEVFRFLTKPWSDDEVKLTLHMALTHVRAEREQARLLKQFEGQTRELRTLEGDHPGIGSVKRDHTGAILIEDDETPSDA